MKLLKLTCVFTLICALFATGCAALADSAFDVTPDEPIDSAFTLKRDNSIGASSYALISDLTLTYSDGTDAQVIDLTGMGLKFTTVMNGIRDMAQLSVDVLFADNTAAAVFAQLTPSALYGGFMGASQYLKIPDGGLPLVLKRFDITDIDEAAIVKFAFPYLLNEIAGSLAEESAFAVPKACYVELDDAEWLIEDASAGVTDGLTLGTQSYVASKYTVNIDSDTMRGVMNATMAGIFEQEQVKEAIGNLKNVMDASDMQYFLTIMDILAKPGDFVYFPNGFVAEIWTVDDQIMRVKQSGSIAITAEDLAFMLNQMGENVDTTDVEAGIGDALAIDVSGDIASIMQPGGAFISAAFSANIPVADVACELNFSVTPTLYKDTSTRRVLSLLAQITEDSDVLAKLSALATLNHIAPTEIKPGRTGFTGDISVYADDENAEFTVMYDGSETLTDGALCKEGAAYATLKQGEEQIKIGAKLTHGVLSALDTPFVGVEGAKIVDLTTATDEDLSDYLVSCLEYMQNLLVGAVSLPAFAQYLISQLM